MYLPYLRGRQFELLALRELVEKNLISPKIIPIIEPINPTPTLITTLQTYSNNKRNISIIINPRVGNFTSKIKKIEDKENKFLKSISQCIKQKEIIKSYIVNKNLVDKIKNDTEKNKFIVINNKQDDISYYKEIYTTEKPIFTLISNKISLEEGDNVYGKVILDDKFNKQERNADYIDINDEFFSKAHKVFSEKGYNGFSDYSIVGQEFKESGFAPMAVAIHIVYFDKNKDLRIKHFVSDSNEDITDPAGKFGEALTKLVLWMDDSNTIMTDALKQFKEYFNTGNYPGLGVVKKLCIMNHLELISKFLDESI